MRGGVERKKKRHSALTYVCFSPEWTADISSRPWGDNGDHKHEERGNQPDHVPVLRKAKEKKNKAQKKTQALPSIASRMIMIRISDRRRAINRRVATRARSCRISAVKLRGRECGRTERVQAASVLTGSIGRASREVEVSKTRSIAYSIVA